MSAAEVNFSFDGLHCLRDFGCIFIEGKSRIITPQMSRDSYEIAGVSGTVLLGDEATRATYRITGTLVPMETPRSLTEAQALARRISAWLTGGRKQLCWDYEPAQMHWAEVNAPTSWGTQVWMDGGLDISFDIQPGAYDLTPTTAQATITGSGSLFLPVHTIIPCPVDIELTNKGSAAITYVKLTTTDGSCVELRKGLSLAAGAGLQIDMTPPIGATITADGSKTSAMRHAVRFDQLRLRGAESIAVETDGTAAVRAMVRGCMP